MTTTTSTRAIGAGSILLALGFNVPYALLASRFDYPGVLREAPERILAAFTEGGAPLVLTWYAFALAAMLFALVEGLSDAERAPEVTEALRALVDRIVLTPELRPGRKRATLTVDLEGALAGILHLAVGEKGAAVAALIQNTLSASGGADVARARNAEEPPILADGGSSESMSKLVAGAGFEPAAFRL